MNRRSFLSVFSAGLVAAPLGAKSVSHNPEIVGHRHVIRRPGLRRVSELPAEAGKVMSMAHFGKHVFICCEHGLWTMPDEDFNK